MDFKATLAEVSPALSGERADRVRSVPPSPPSRETSAAVDVKRVIGRPDGHGPRELDWLEKIMGRGWWIRLSWRMWGSIRKRYSVAPSDGPRASIAHASLRASTHPPPPTTTTSASLVMFTSWNVFLLQAEGHAPDQGRPGSCWPRRMTRAPVEKSRPGRRIAACGTPRAGRAEAPRDADRCRVRKVAGGGDLQKVCGLPMCGPAVVSVAPVGNVLPGASPSGRPRSGVRWPRYAPFEKRWAGQGSTAEQEPGAEFTPGESSWRRRA